MRAIEVLIVLVVLAVIVMLLAATVGVMPGGL